MSERVKWAELSARERDALVAIHLFGWRRDAYWAGDEQQEGLFHDRVGFRDAVELGPPHFTTSIAAAWNVVEKLDCNFDLHHYPRDTDQETFEVDGPPKTWCAVTATRYAEAWGDTAPEAIAIAALRAVSVEVDTTPAPTPDGPES